jgi:hypothetical protein
MASAIRSTILISSLAGAERAGRLAVYRKLVPQQHLQTLSELVAGQWLPIELGVAHYATMDQLFSQAEARENGRAVAESIQNSHFATVLRTLGAGVTVWTVLPRIAPFIGRIIRGGECAVYRLGPKDARVELHGLPMACFEYARCGWAGMLEGTLSMVARKVYARDVSTVGTQSVAKFTLAWA